MESGLYRCHVNVIKIQGLPECRAPPRPLAAAQACRPGPPHTPLYIRSLFRATSPVCLLRRHCPCGTRLCAQCPCPGGRHQWQVADHRLLGRPQRPAGRLWHRPAPGRRGRHRPDQRTRRRERPRPATAHGGRRLRAPAHHRQRQTDDRPGLGLCAAVVRGHPQQHRHPARGGRSGHALCGAAHRRLLAAQECPQRLPRARQLHR